MRNAGGIALLGTFVGMVAAIGCNAAPPRESGGEVAATDDGGTEGNLVGLWRGDDVVLDLTPAEQVVVRRGREVGAGLYRLIPDGRIETTIAIDHSAEGSGSRSFRWKLGAGGQSLVLTDAAGRVRSLERVEGPAPERLDGALFGSWTTAGGDSSLELTPHGTVVERTPAGLRAGSWLAPGEGRLVMELEGRAGEETVEPSYRMDDGRLELRSADGTSRVWVRRLPRPHDPIGRRGG